MVVVSVLYRLRWRMAKRAERVAFEALKSSFLLYDSCMGGTHTQAEEAKRRKAGNSCASSPCYAIRQRSLYNLLTTKRAAFSGVLNSLKQISLCVESLAHVVQLIRGTPGT